uniref:Zona pellucida-binding protein 1-like isoform X1 n=2 Tax=Pogona vitticeps TaxID=103695 RepID=A0A6J0SR58_9SAUR
MCCPAVAVTLGILALLFCDRPGCGEIPPDTHHSDNGTSSGLENVGEPSPPEAMDPIYVHIGAKEITLPCKPSKTDVVFGMNPSYNWSLDNGEIHALPGDATLTLHMFRPEDSGLYECSISYIKQGQLHTKTFYHTVVGYHIRGELEILLVFESSSCDEDLTRGFLRTLHEQLNQVVSRLHTEILVGDTTCFPTLNKPLDAFNLQVALKVSPFIKGWDESCSPKIDQLEFECYHSAVQTNLQKAKDALTDFFEENKHFHLGKTLGSRASFINTFFNFLEGGKCQSGYGQTQELEERCPDCCTLCPPGTYSEAAVDGCVLCPTGTYSLHYGTSVCIMCQHNWPTEHPGARRAGECMSSRASLSRRFPVLMMALVLLPLGCLCLIVLFCYRFRRRWKMIAFFIAKDEQIDQEKETPILSGDVALQDSQGYDSPVPPPSLEQPYNEAVIFPPCAEEAAEHGPEEATEHGPEEAIEHGPENVAILDSQEQESLVPLSPNLEHPADNEAVMSSPPATLENQPGGVTSPPPPMPEELPVLEDDGFPPSSPATDVESDDFH